MAKEQKMTYFQCIKLLEACIKNGVLASDPDDANGYLYTEEPEKQHRKDGTVNRS